MPEPDDHRILYVAGYSRCGSTIADMILNGHPQVASAGELVYLQDDAAAGDRLCTCGRRYRDCEIYGGWVRDRDPAEAETMRRIESRPNLSRLLAGRTPPREAEIYRGYARSLFEHLHARHGAAVMVDGSKSARDAAGRPLALLRLAGLDVRILHLTRNPRATIRSYIEHGSNWVAEGYCRPRPLETWRPILGWTLANRLALRLGREEPQRYMRLKFEDLLANPRAALDQIGAFAGLDLSGVAERVVAGDSFTAGHNVGGNRTRLAPQRINLAPKPVEGMPRGHALGTSLLCGATARRLGYV